MTKIKSGDVLLQGGTTFFQSLGFQKWGAICSHLKKRKGYGQLMQKKPKNDHFGPFLNFEKKMTKTGQKNGKKR